MKKSSFYITSIIIAIVVACLWGEGLCRLFLRGQYSYRPHNDQQDPLYRYDQELGWFTAGGKECYFSGLNRKIFVKNNSLGFRDHEYGKKEKRRILFLGDSYVWGYDAEQGERFTEKLQRRLPNYEILNFGVNGYGTTQEYLLLKKYFNSFKPEIVFLIFSPSGFDNNSSYFGFDGYFKPYFVLKKNKLVLKGVPVPQGLNHFRNYCYYKCPSLFKSHLFNTVLTRAFQIAELIFRVPDPTEKVICEMGGFLKANHSLFIIGEIRDVPFLEGICKKNNIAYLPLKTFEYPKGGHWTPEGHEFVCRTLFDFLLKSNYITKNTTAP